METANLTKKRDMKEEEQRRQTEKLDGKMGEREREKTRDNLEIGHLREGRDEEK